MPINKAVKLLGNVTFLHFNGFLNIPGRVNDFPTIKFWVHPRHAVFKDEKPDLGFVLLLFIFYQFGVDLIYELYSERHL